MTTIPDSLRSAFDRERAATRAATARAKDAAALRQDTVRMYGRLAELQSTVLTEVKTACEAGCDHCCHLRVEVRPYEAFVVAQHLKSRVPAERRAIFVERLRGNHARIHPLSPETHNRAGIACAFLVEGRCGVYEARPAACRKYYSVAVDACRAVRENPSAPRTREIENETLRLAGNAIALGYAQGIEEAGLDATLVELHRAVLSAVESDKPEKRWRDGKKPFV